MERPIRFRATGGVALLVMAAAPANALGPRMRAALGEMIGQLAREPAIRAIMIAAEGAMFSAGLDLHESGPFFAAPDPGDLTRLIEDCRKPVVALLQGQALALGAELALAAHYRLALGQAAMGFPDGTLGVIPLAGATQRLPRLIGAGPALDLMQDGRALSATQGMRLGLIDGVVQGDLMSGGLAWVQAALAQGRGPRPAATTRGKLSNGAAAMANITARRARLPQDALPAARALVDAVEAGLTMPYDAALSFERTLYEDCLATPAARALRYLLLAERRIAPALLARDGRARHLTPAGQAVASRLTRALSRASAALLRANTPPEAVDAALVAWGLPRSGSPAIAAPALLAPIVAALAAEGARALADGQVARASDVDVIAHHGLGLARSAGGPMHTAEVLGLDRLAAGMRGWVSQDRIWAMPQPFHRALDTGRFADAP